MALASRRGGRSEVNIWPGFVDAMTALLMIIMFVLTIFMVMQAVQRDLISGQESELDKLAGEVTALSQALGLAQQQSARLEDDLSALQGERERQESLIANLTGRLDAQARTLAERDAAIASFEEQVATLLSQRDEAIATGEQLTASVAELEAAQERLISEQEAMQLALARARDEVDAQAEAARLAAARREALEALTAELQAKAQADATALDEAEAARLADAAAAEALRKRLENADAELTAMSLALEEQRRQAEETLTLLAAADAAEAELNERLATVLTQLQEAETTLETSTATEDQLRASVAALTAERDELSARLAALEGSDLEAGELRDRLAAALAERLAAEQQANEAMTERERQETLLAAARERLQQEEAVTERAQLQVEALNQQIAALRGQLGDLQGLLDSAANADEAAQIRIETLGSQLNQALARAAAEEKRRAELEAAEAERLRIEAERLSEENLDLADYRSEFFGTLRRVLGDRPGIQIVGDRFVFSSEVLFESASATLAPAGREQIREVAAILSDVSDQIPDSLDWIIRVDGHTDNVPLSGTGEFADNWELSQARALSVVRYMTDALGFPPERLAATGFGEYRPVDPADTPEARAANRRIELKLTER
jgi:chemotaxis protein MotB